jgi:hypothetical protein
MVFPYAYIAEISTRHHHRQTEEEFFHRVAAARGLHEPFAG